MNREFVTYEQALALKELGIDQRCYASYGPVGARAYKELSYGYADYNMGNCIGAPTFSQAFRWFREKYDLHGCIDLHCSTPIHWFIRIDKIDINDYLYHSEDDNIQYSTYEEAELACLDKLLQIVKAAGVQE